MTDLPVSSAEGDILLKGKARKLGGAGRNHELVGGTRQRWVPEFLTLLEPGSPIGHLQPLHTFFWHQSRAPALQNTTTEWATTQPEQDEDILALSALGSWQREDWVSKQQEQAPSYISTIQALPQAVGMLRVRLSPCPALELELECRRCTTPRLERGKIRPSPCSAGHTGGQSCAVFPPLGTNPQFFQSMTVSCKENKPWSKQRTTSRKAMREESAAPWSHLDQRVTHQFIVRMAFPEA